MGSCRKGKIGIIAKFYRTNLVIRNHSRGTKTPSYSRINTVWVKHCLPDLAYLFRYKKVAPPYKVTPNIKAVYFSGVISFLSSKTIPKVLSDLHFKFVISYKPIHMQGISWREMSET